MRTPSFAQSGDETNRIKITTYFFVQISQIFTNKCSDIFVWVSAFLSTGSTLLGTPPLGNNSVSEMEGIPYSQQ